MQRLTLSFLATAASLWVAVWIVGGLDFTGTWWQFLIAAAIMGGANAFVKPIIKFFSFPLILLTMGLFLLIVNALVLQLVIWLAGPDVFNLGFTSSGFFWATFLGAIVITIVGWVIDAVLSD